MAEFNLGQTLGQPQYPSYAQPQQPSGSMEWYSGGSSAHYGSQHTYAYDAHASSSGAAYGSFEDEPPLLEGGRCCRLGAVGGRGCSCLATRGAAAAAQLPAAHFPHPHLAHHRHAELGIDIPAILSRTRSVITFRLSGHDLDHFDMGGPLIFMVALGVLHLLVSTEGGCRPNNAWLCAAPLAHCGASWLSPALVAASPLQAGPHARPNPAASPTPPHPHSSCRWASYTLATS